MACQYTESRPTLRGGHVRYTPGLFYNCTTTTCLSLSPVLLVHAHHDARHLRAAHDGWEDRARGVVASETRLAHAAAVVHHQRGNLRGCRAYELGFSQLSNYLDLRAVCKRFAPLCAIHLLSCGVQVQLSCRSNAPIVGP